MSVFPEEIVEHIFSFSDTYNVVNAAVCTDFRRIAPKVHPLEHLDHLLSRGQITLDLSGKPFLKVMSLVKQATHMQLLSILEACEDYIPANLCQTAVTYGLVKVLYWSRSTPERKSRYPWYADAESSDPEVLQWMREEPFMANFD